MSKKQFSPTKYISKNITQSDVIQIKAAFDILDSDSSGTITPAEIKKFFDQLSLNQSKEAVYEALKEMDDNYDGGIEFEEYFRYMTNVYSNAQNKEELAPMIEQVIKTRETKVIQNKTQTKTILRSAKPTSEQEDSIEPSGGKIPETFAAKISHEPKSKKVLRAAKPPSQQDASIESIVKVIPEDVKKKAPTSQESKNKGIGSATISQPKNSSFDPSKYVRPDLSLEEIKNIKKAFDLVDENKSGLITPSEIIKMFETTGAFSRNPLIYNILGDWDKDLSGGIDFAEFLKIVTQKNSNKGNSMDELSFYFDFFDENKDGKITWNELKKVAQYLGEEMSDEEIKEMFNRADLDNDGLVTKEDFYNIVNGIGY